MKVIYVIGPYRSKTDWGIEENIQRAEQAALKLWQEGWAVICPHKNTAHFGGACDDKVWLNGDLEILSRCDAVFVLKGWPQSEYSVKEVRLSMELDLEIIFDDDVESTMVYKSMLIEKKSKSLRNHEKPSKKKKKKVIKFIPIKER